MLQYLIPHTFTIFEYAMPYREHSMEPYHIITRINYKMNKEITYHSFFKNEYISKEYNRIDADDGIIIVLP